MIELRWAVPEHPFVPSASHGFREFPRLQYRVYTDEFFRQPGTVGGVWSEWKDVPTEIVKGIR